MKLLNLTLTGLINESTGLEGIIYLYDDDSTHIATMMNLAYDILKIIPLYSDYKNSDTGSKPRLAEKLVKRKLGEFKDDFEWWNPDDWAEAFEDWYDDLMDWFEELIEAFIKLLSDLVAFVLDSIAAVADFIGNVVEAVVEAGLALVEAIVAAVMAVLEAMLKGILLTLAILLLAFTLIYAVSSFVYMISMVLFISTFIDIQITTDNLYIKLETQEETLEYGISSTWLYVSFVDLELPFLMTLIVYNGEIVSNSIEPVLLGDFISFSDYEITEQSESSSDSEAQSESSNLGIHSSQSSSSNLVETFNSNFNWGFGIVFAALGVIIGGLIASHKMKTTAMQVAVSVLFLSVLGIFVMNIIIWWVNEKIDDLDTNLKLIAFGLGIAIGLMSIGGLLKIAFGSKKEDFTKYLKIAFWTIIFMRAVVVLFGIIGLNNVFSPYELEEVQIFIQNLLYINLGIFFLIVIIAHYSTINQDLRRQFAILGTIALYSGVGFYMVIMGTLNVFLLIHLADIIDILLGKEVE